MVGREEGKSRSKVRKTVFLSGDEYTIFLIPKEINAKENVFKFVLEIYKTQNRGELAPLAVGFFFDDKICFLTFTVGVSMSSFGGSIGSGLTWTILLMGLSGPRERR